MFAEPSPMVRTSGLEPPTPCMSSKYSNQLSYALLFRGGDEEDRTPDLTDANRTRSQLRYGPTLIFGRR